MLATTRRSFRTALWSWVLGLAVAAACIAFFVIAVRNGNGDAGWLEISVGWLIAGCALVGGLALVWTIVSEMLGREQRVEVTADEIRIVRGGRRLAGLSVSDVLRLTCLDGQRTTLAGQRGPGDTSRRGLRARLRTEIIVRGENDEISFPAGPGYLDALVAFAQWVERHPAIEVDAATAARLATAGSRA